ncbi:MAG TPA: LptA/OstA family protein [Verrucomicrobiae bacterium]|jgi:lipopolysaccharide export system protein LptA|nr:LptA/OstA family protein [Verrucomicrobiae bacterium]
MKFYCLVILVLACGAAGLSAQTNTGTNASAGTNGVESILALVTTNRPATSPATNQPATRPRGPIFIHSSGPAVVDMENHWVTYSDSVLVTNPEMKLTCEWAKADFPANWEQATNVVAQTNVVVDYIDPKGQKGRALGDRAVYLFQIVDGLTNETVTLTGDLTNRPPEVEAGDNYTNHQIADRIVYDVRTGKVTFDNPSGIFFPGTSTNGPTGSKSRSHSNLPLSQ